MIDLPHTLSFTSPGGLLFSSLMGVQCEYLSVNYRRLGYTEY